MLEGNIVYAFVRVGQEWDCCELGVGRCVVRYDV